MLPCAWLLILNRFPLEPHSIAKWYPMLNLKAPCRATPSSCRHHDILVLPDAVLYLAGLHWWKAYSFRCWSLYVHVNTSLLNQSGSYMPGKILYFYCTKQIYLIKASYKDCIVIIFEKMFIAYIWNIAGWLNLDWSEMKSLRSDENSWNAWTVKRLLKELCFISRQCLMHDQQEASQAPFSCAHQNITVLPSIIHQHAWNRWWQISLFESLAVTTVQQYRWHPLTGVLFMCSPYHSSCFWSYISWETPVNSGLAYIWGKPNCMFASMCLAQHWTDMQIYLDFWARSPSPWPWWCHKHPSKALPEFWELVWTRLSKANQCCTFTTTKKLSLRYVLGNI